jgi:hypothetical protein
VAAYIIFRRTVSNIVQVNEGKDGQPNVVVDIPGVPRISAGGTVSEADLGVPIYPGAEPEKDGTTSISMSGGANGGGWLGVATYRTNDSVGDVASFYREKLGGDVKVTESSESGKETAVFHLESTKGWRMVTVVREERESVTKIVIASVSGKQAEFGGPNKVWASRFRSGILALPFPFPAGVESKTSWSG